MQNHLPTNMENESDSALCDKCSEVDFDSLFQPESKAYHLGTLSWIAQTTNCALCLFVKKAISKYWKSWENEVWKPDVSDQINIWIKTTLWAHCSDGFTHDALHSHDPRTQRSRFLRFRPALGSDWDPDPRRRSSYGLPRYTLCDLDRGTSSGGFEAFPRDQAQDRWQTQKRRLIPEKVDISLLRNWITECQTNHGHRKEEEMQAQLRKTLRFRLIDVQSGTLVQPTEYIDYIALSYVWGDFLRDQQPKDREKWLRDLFVDDVPDSSNALRYLCFDNLPATIRDAISMVKSMGWRYLWIDLICIQQNDVLDREVMVKQMNLIYEGASFTMVVAGGGDANARLPGLEESARESEQICRIDTKAGPLLLTFARPSLKSLLDSTTWSTRGWTFQEDILSHACLYFTPTEVFYSCRHHLSEHELPRIGDYAGFMKGRFSEWRESYVLETRSITTASQATSQWNEGWTKSGTKSLRYSVGTVMNPSQNYTFLDERGQLSEFQDRFMEYAGLVAEYTGRELSNNDDIVAAFMGILNKYRSVSDEVEAPIVSSADDHGLLDSHFGRCLFWVPVENCYLERRRTSARDHPRFPSWAWAGWVGPVEYLMDKPSQGWFGVLDWNFKPPTFSPKVPSLATMRPLTCQSIGHGRIAGWYGVSHVRYLEEARALLPPGSGPTCTLILHTHVADVKFLIPCASFVARKLQHWKEYPHTMIIMGNGRSVHIILDSHSRVLHSPTEHGPDRYKLVVIGEGMRLMKEFVVLLVEQSGECYERIGLTTVKSGDFEGDLEWIRLV